MGQLLWSLTPSLNAIYNDVDPPHTGQIELVDWRERKHWQIRRHYHESQVDGNTQGARHARFLFNPQDSGNDRLYTILLTTRWQLVWIRGGTWCPIRWWGRNLQRAIQQSSARVRLIWWCLIRRERITFRYAQLDGWAIEGRIFRGTEESTIFQHRVFPRRHMWVKSHDITS